MIKNVFLDIDETLFDFHKSEREAITKTMIYFNIEPTEEIISRYSELNLSQWKLLEQGILTIDEVKIRRYELLFKELNIVGSPKEAAAYYEKRLGESYYFMEGAKELLENIHKDYRLYIASNGTAVVQWQRIKSANIEHYFSGIFISQEIGFNKPRVEFFENSFAKIPDFKKEETVIVGDSLTSDIQGGKNAGITTIWFNPRHEEKTEIVPDYEIHSLDEVVALLASL